MVLQRAEVVHLVALAEVDGDLLALGPLADEAGVGAHAGVVAAEGDRGQQRVRVALAARHLVSRSARPGGPSSLTDR